MSMRRNYDKYLPSLIGTLFSGENKIRDYIRHQITADRRYAIENDPYSFLKTVSISRFEADLLTMVTNCDPKMMNHLAACNGAYLEHVIDPTPEIIDIAIRKFPSAICYMKSKPADYLVESAFLRNPDSFRNYGLTSNERYTDRITWITDELLLKGIDAGLFDIPATPPKQRYNERLGTSSVLFDIKNLSPDMQTRLIEKNPDNAYCFLDYLSSEAQTALSKVYNKLGKITKTEIRKKLTGWNTDLKKAILDYYPWDMRKYMDKLSLEEIDYAKNTLIALHKGDTFEKMCKRYGRGGAHISVPLFALSETEQTRVIENVKNLSQYSFLFIAEHLQVYCVLNGSSKPKKNKR